MDIDVQKEWRELVETYSQMADEDLQSLAAEGYELTDLAKQALQSQLKARGLKADLVGTPPVSEDDTGEPQGDLNPADLPLVHCSDAWSADEARTIMDTLYSAGIPAYLGPDLVEKVDDFRGSYEKSVQIQVRDADVQRAVRALSRVEFPKTDEADEDKGDYQAKCPNCGSEEIVFLEFDRASSQPGTEPKFHWHCDACDADWEDDGVEER